MWRRRRHTERQDREKEGMRDRGVNWYSLRPSISPSLLRSGTCANDGARAACPVAAAAAFFGAAMRPATGDEGLGEFLELGLGFIGFGQCCRERIELRPTIAQKIEIERLAIEQVLDIEQNRWR